MNKSSFRLVCLSFCIKFVGSVFFISGAITADVNFLIVAYVLASLAWYFERIDKGEQ